MRRSRPRELRFDPPYEALFSDLLAFGTLAETEQTLKTLENLRQRFLAASDKKGVEYCRQLGLLGRERATMIARNPRVGQDKRLMKGEAALWFRIWLETPELFTAWLALRQATSEFQNLKDKEAS
jgi:hypothetical protein